MSVRFFSDPFAEDIFKKKYQGTAYDVHDFYYRLADLMSRGVSLDRLLFHDMLINKRFSPGGRILAFAGRPDARVSLMNCTTHTIEDDTLEAINETALAVMRASSRGQGIGIDISNLRPMGAVVNNAARTSSGAISFMEMLNAVGATIGQNGRRGALLFSINDDHPDLWRPGAQDIEGPNGMQAYDFLNVKRIPGKVENANISVRLSDTFMRAVKEDDTWELRFSGRSGRDGFSNWQVLQARELFEQLASSAHASAEPGVLFWDTARRKSNSDLFGNEWEISGVNACTEQVLDQEGVCNLGSLNLAAYVRESFTKDAYFSAEAFISDVKTAVRFLDNALDIELEAQRYISERQRRSIIFLRRIGLGVMGLADALARMNIPYGNNPQAEKAVRNIFFIMRRAAYEESIELAKAKGPALAWTHTDNSRASILSNGSYADLPYTMIEEILKHGTRNVSLLSVAPTGTISNLVGVSSGIEPLFAHQYVRRHRMNGAWESVNYIHPGVALSRSKGIPDSAWPTAYEISPYDHLAVQAWAQEYVDQSISKTTNFPSTAEVKDVADVYMRAWELGLKGMAVYVDGSRHEQVLHVSEPEKDESCPSCGGKLVHESGCTHCSECEWELCSI